jgi:hypothetical protein
MARTYQDWSDRSAVTGAGRSGKTKRAVMIPEATAAAHTSGAVFRMGSEDSGAHWLGQTIGSGTKPKLLSPVGGALALLLFLPYVFMHQVHFNGPTAVSRLDLLHALVTHGTVQIDAYHENTPDKAKFDGHYYSDKAPGTVALALPAFLLAAVVLDVAGVSLESETGWRVSSWVACAGSIGLLTALGGWACFAWLSRYVAPRRALLVTLALFLGAAPLPYATMMFSHALVVGLLAIALWALDREAVVAAADPEAERRWVGLAGLACGWALVSELSAGLVVAGLIAWLLSRKGNTLRRLGWFAVGFVPPMLLLPLYSWLCFGNPLTLAYSHQASFPEMQKGLYAIQWPDAATAFNLLFSPTRGLLFWTPFLALAWLGYVRLAERSRALFWLCYAVPVLQVVIISGRVWDWQAGPTLGPRLLAPMLPLLALPCALGVARWPKVGLGLAAVSIGLTSLATLTDATPSGHIYNPLLELHLPLLRRGELSPNLGTVLGLPPLVSVAVFYAPLAGGFWWLWRRLPNRVEPAVSQRTPEP